MDMSVTPITSDTQFSDIEHHFRVSAGPGAGKTHWLVEHLKNVLRHSTRLGNTRKIACITYTNIAVETILNRLGTSAEQVEVSTIHSFLYKNIVKPYAHFISSDYELNVAKIDGHDDLVIGTKKTVTWIENHPNKNSFSHPYTINQLTKLETNKQGIIRWLASIFYTFNQNNNLQIVSDRTEAYYIENGSRRMIGKACLDRLEPDLLGFKKLYWREGMLHHDDVLFFSYQIIQKHPFVLEILRIKFPYFFIDEFQDSSPIQIEIVKRIGQDETIIGIIGDKAQSIYGFQGADNMHFMSFRLPNIRDYIMADNRRSTNEIIDILNTVRKDMVQKKYRNQIGERPILIVGDPISSLKKAQTICKDGIVCSLSRTNITSNVMKKEVSGVSLNEKILDQLNAIDSNKDRSRLITSCIKAIELANEKKIKDAIKELQRCFSKNEEGKKQTLKYLMLLVSKYNDYKNNTLMDFYNLVKAEINNSLSGFRHGTIKDFYDNNRYQDLALCVKIPEDVSLHKTIHKAKGDEFNNVLVILQDEKDISFLLNPDLDKEEHRVRYVAISRAKEMLFISTPTLCQTNFEALKTLINVQFLQ
jgi:DNA helicase-2/ATP-dependent DNA helicase PcrA